MERSADDLHPKTETVLVLQGGGSLGAYECGVYKCLYKNGIKFDVLAGSSIGAINHFRHGSLYQDIITLD